MQFAASAATGGGVGTAIMLLAMSAILLVAAAAWWRKVVPYNRWVRQNMSRTAQPNHRWTEQLGRVSGSVLMLGFAVVLAFAAFADLRGTS